MLMSIDSDVIVTYFGKDGFSAHQIDRLTESNCLWFALSDQVNVTIKKRTTNHCVGEDSKPCLVGEFVIMLTYFCIILVVSLKYIFSKQRFKSICLYNENEDFGANIKF